MRSWRIWEQLGRARGKIWRSAYGVAAERSRDCKGTGAQLAKRLTGAGVLPVDDTAGKDTYLFVDNFR